VLLDNFGNNLPVSGDGADCGFLVLTHEAAVALDIGTEDCGELTFEVLGGHAGTSLKYYRGQAKKIGELQRSNGSTGSEV
jgi:hypothetical protein